MTKQKLIMLFTVADWKYTLLRINRSRRLQIASQTMLQAIQKPQKLHFLILYLQKLFQEKTLFILITICLIIWEKITLEISWFLQMKQMQRQLLQSLNNIFYQKVKPLQMNLSKQRSNLRYPWRSWINLTEL